MKLCIYSEITHDQFSDYITEWEATGERIVPSATDRRGRSFGELQDAWRTEESEAMNEWGLVPATLYFLVDAHQKILGAIHHRHELTERLMQNGGHIGYGVRPSERGRGVASVMLSMLLQELRGRGHDRVLITCDDDNASSAGVIEKAGGRLQDRPVFEGKLTRRYWIELGE